MMEDTRPEEITRALKSAADGDGIASAELLKLLYADLRRLARARMNALAPGQTLQPTALVHEAYLKLARYEGDGWDGRAHFFAAAARAMRDILVDQARSKSAQKRGGGRAKQEIHERDLQIQPPGEDVIAVDELVRELEAEDPRKGQIVNLRFFAGLTIEETAATLGVSVGTVEREWRYIRTWLRSRLEARRES